MRLHLVRHGLPAIDREIPASRWELDPAGFDEIERLREAGVLPATRARWFCSSEPKAVQTTRRLRIGSDVEVVELHGIREAGRPADWMDPGQFQAAVVRSLDHPGTPSRPGWETSESVRERMLRALRDHVTPAASTTPSEAAEVVLVGHGTAWTILVAALTGRPPDLDGWRAMRMPDHCLLDADIADAEHLSWRGVGRVVSGWGSWDQR